MFERILVAIDGSEESTRAADVAIELSKKDSASLFVITVVHDAVVVYSEQGAASNLPIDKARADAERFMKSTVSRAEAQGVKVRGEIVEKVPSVVDAIVDNADEWKVDLVVVGTRGLTGLKKLLLGSVSNSVLHYANCSVLVVK